MSRIGPLTVNKKGIFQFFLEKKKMIETKKKGKEGSLKKYIT
jgi:hypothetical protein